MLCRPLGNWGGKSQALGARLGGCGFYPADMGEPLKVLEQGGSVGFCFFFPSWVPKSSSSQQGDEEEVLNQGAGDREAF